jgi:hypothetical protein
MIIGQPLLFNYYTIFSVQDGKVGFYEADYTQSAKTITAGAWMSIIMFSGIFVSGIIGCIYQYKKSQSEQPSQVTIRPRSNKNKVKQKIERGWMSKNGPEEINETLIHTSIQ